MHTVDVQGLTARLVEWHAVSTSLAARWFGKTPARAE
jgi:hypothetical protein